MPDKIFNSPLPFVPKKRTRHIPVTLVTEKQGWLKKQSAAVKKLTEEENFTGKAGQILILRDSKGGVSEIVAGVSDKIKLYDLAGCADALTKKMSPGFLKKASFELQGKEFDVTAMTRAHIGWGLACYGFDAYKKSNKKIWPALVISGKVDKKRVQAFVESIFGLRNMINMPANDMGPAELAKAAQKIAVAHKAKIKIMKDKELKAGFPMVYAVGDSSPRRPCLIDLTWGNPKNPKVTLVGKGVCFDTGGLNLKPPKYMELMKKDMAGAAHVLAAAHIIMALKIPVRLRVIVPAVENSVSGTSFRPGDVIPTRKGIWVENTNTDAEGRLILSDALTLASEEKPDLIVDFATLTGSARAALGPEVAAAFSNNDKLADQIRKISFEAEDAVWPMPLWQPYQKYIESSVGDIVNSSSLPGDLIYSALFLERFLVGRPDWIHLDCYAWEGSGRPGRPRGGADTGLRAIVALIEERYGR